MDTLREESEDLDKNWIQPKIYELWADFKYLEINDQTILSSLQNDPSF